MLIGVGRAIRCPPRGGLGISPMMGLKMPLGILILRRISRIMPCFRGMMRRRKRKVLFCSKKYCIKGCNPMFCMPMRRKETKYLNKWMNLNSLVSVGDVLWIEINLIV